MNNMTEGQSCMLMWLGSSTKGFKEYVSLEHYTVIRQTIVPLAIISLPLCASIRRVQIYSQVNKHNV